MGDADYGKICDFYLPPEDLHLFDGPAGNIKDMLHALDRGTSSGGQVVGNVIELKLGLQPGPSCEHIKELVSNELADEELAGMSRARRYRRSVAACLEATASSASRHLLSMFS